MIGLNKIWLNQVQLNRLYLNAPFPVYRKMTGGGSSGDGFPVLPGDVTRWHFGGLTNEMMAAMDDPRLEDADGKGRFLSFKNFAWKGMSGVGGYVTNKDIYEYDLDRYSYTFIESSTKVHDFYIVFELIGYDENFKDGFTLDVRSISQGLKYRKTYTKNGIYIFQYKDEEGLDGLFAAGYNGNGGARSNFTVKILPLYPGFILGDGVDDFAVTEKELNFEDTYTVYTAFIPFQNNPTKNMMMAGKDIKDFYMNYSSINALSYYSGNKSVIINLSNGFNLLCCKRDADNMTIKNLITGDSVTATANEFINNPGLCYLWRVANGYSYARLAIAGQTICNGYFSTDEDDEKVLDWYKKQYSWLFFDQAWTVTGKTNEDEDRAAIANITGNGNDLVLSNFGFAEGSGYGLYAENYAGGRWVQSTDRADLTWTSYSVNITSVKVASTQLYYQSYPEQPSFIVPSYKIKVYGLKDGQTLSYRQATSEGQQLYRISEDGTYTLPSFPFKANRNWYGFILNKVQESCDITIEQIPEYEGYLVTDGVDDKIFSSIFKLGKDFTVVGEWEFLQDINNNSGLRKISSFIIRNNASGLSLLINRTSQATTVFNVKSLKAFCSNGLLVKNDWTEQIDTVSQIITSSNSKLSIACHGDGVIEYDKFAFKNLAIYPTILSKDDCIKAYNYLQTLKAK